MKTSSAFLLIATFLFTLPFNVFSTNPDLSKYLINLSESDNGVGLYDYVPEIAVSGNTVHTLWVQRVSNSEANLYYRRSTNLGETWEAPQLLKVLKDAGLAKDVTNRRLAVDNNTVHIAIADYVYADNGTGHVYYLKSSNGGASFGAEKIIASTSGGYKRITNSFIRAQNGNVVVAYLGNGDKKGVYSLFSGNGGGSFTENKIWEDSNALSDLYYNGSKIVIVHGYSYYMYGLSTGRVWVSASSNGTAFTTNKISVTFPTDYGEKERSICSQDYHYTPKIAVSGNNIFVVFAGYKSTDEYATFYVRSTNGGTSFEPAVEFTSEEIESLQGGSETVAAKGDHVYLLAASSYPMNNNNGNQFYLAHSENNGASFSAPRSILNPDVPQVGKASLPGITVDPNDESGKTVYLTGNWLFSTKSVDGGKTFSGSSTLAPFLESAIVNMSHNYMNSYMTIDENGGIHWISSAYWRTSDDNDIFYRNVREQPEPGDENKAFLVDVETKSYQKEVLVVPSSESINLSSAITVEAWVKFDPLTESKSSIITKVNGIQASNGDPTAYQIDFFQDKEAIYINAGIQTDKGVFVNHGKIDLKDNLWHHIALTYDANGELNNLKMYINGVLHKQQTVLGEMIQEDGMLMIGTSGYGNSWYNTTKFQLDDVRLWKRALTAQEIADNQFKTLSGKENGLALFLNFDDTFKDLSGNGNDAIPIYQGKLNKSNFDPPMANFESYQVANEVSFNNKTKNATGYNWDFGDENSSEKANPKYGYPTPGEYEIVLAAKNATAVTSALGHASIKGLDRVEPAEAGNIGESLLTVFGGGLKPEMKMLLRFADNTEIEADTIVGSGEDGFIQAVFNLNGATIGVYDAVMLDKGNEMVLPESFTVKQAEGVAEPWVNVSGRSTVLLNRWNKYTITYGNKGDVDALMVPVSFAVPDISGLEVDYMDFKFVLPDEVFTYNLENELMPYKDFFVTDVLFGKPQPSKVYSLMIPRIKANSSESLHILIKSPVNYTITSWTGDGWFYYTNGSENNTKSGFIGQQLHPNAKMGDDDPLSKEDRVAVGSCIVEALAVTAIETSISVIPYAGAIYNSGKSVYVNSQFDTKDVKKSVRNSALQGATTFFAVAGVVPVVGWIASTVGGLICGGISAYYAVSDCLSLANKEKSVSTVSSFDPNEIIGPDGFGTEGWIQKLSEMPYTILFENKAEATAPAHDVFIADTLDLTVFDAADFGFGAFGWGDSIFSPLGNQLSEFSMDIDMRPQMNLITRVSAKFDAATGIIRWEFLSLNPETMALEDDPFIGFLPPNVSSPEGEGFVSYSVGTKNEMANKAEIRNQANIVFDANKPIVTNEYLNTLDLIAPESRVLQLDETISGTFEVSWAGSDQGSGVKHYTIYVMENDTAMYAWMQNTTKTSAEFLGEIGSTYKFYSIATDNVGHEENAPADYDARTTIVVGAEDFEWAKQELTVWPNPVSDKLQIKLENAPCGTYRVELIALNGTVSKSFECEDMDLKSGIDINVSECKPGQYILRVALGNQLETRKITVQ